ncbi:hypothetical protein [Sinorhizobium meliloti]|uniref:hypothetical protein n=1 Tax=Rhizobium meliloti TaxID=382 RepID=UPI000FD92D6D|nr:hypothetical protein [Sinorhizobium meliloti]RVG88657.1 hypothetical protein CN219_03555 [Sinorhizobium meliloti]RVI39061.1 hypothetical protein CN197_02680 [Sinorhizobium meliloti]RVI46696.1 hypothetical protein CN196_09530 [Sinorhizobium meliloti]RVJ25698.1 hypothetical protein CN177_13570 [Sinorhizobium meliloti]RVK02223.1 hypothetical protein CN170_08560 [Sinorhizobium meliloti]
MNQPLRTAIYGGVRVSFCVDYLEQSATTEDIDGAIALIGAMIRSAEFGNYKFRETSEWDPIDPNGPKTWEGTSELSVKGSAPLKFYSRPTSPSE